MNHGITRGKRVLIVEDEPVIAQIFEEILAAEGFNLDFSADGETARNILRHETYDLCVLNIHLPGLSGIELFKFLQRERPEQCARVLFTTGDILSRNTQAFLKETGRPCLIKPFNPGELRSAISKALGQAGS